MTSRTLLNIAAIVGVLGIAIGAFGAHVLPNIVPDLSETDLLERIAWHDTGVKYHMYHAAALLALALAADKWDRVFRVTALAWLVGIVLFSGSLYVMSVTGIRILGAVVPLGGIAFIVGWAALLISPARRGE